MAAKKAEAVKSFPKPTEKDFAIIKGPMVTEKSMAMMQNQNKVTVKVCECANKTSVKIAFERIFQVKVVDVKIVNVRAKVTTRGTRYTGSISGFKKAVVTLADGAAIDLFKE